MTRAVAWTTLISLVLGIAGAQPESGSDFYAGKNVTYIVATSPGGGYDAYARMIGAYFEKYLAADHVIVRNVPGAGHLIGANTLARSKPDGLTIGTFNVGLIYGQLSGNRSLRFDLRDLEWIGKAAGEARAVVVAEGCHVKSMDDLLMTEEPVVFAGAGIGSASYADTRLLAAALGLNVRIIPGYEGSESEMAMLRGEICGLVASASSLEGFVDAGNGRFILAIGGQIPGVPNAMDYATNESARQVVGLVSAMAKLGRITAAPPGTPPNRLADLRAAYHAALDDPDLLADAARSRRPIEPAFGEDVARLVTEALDQTPETIAIVTDALAPEWEHAGAETSYRLALAN